MSTRPISKVNLAVNMINDQALLVHNGEESRKREKEIISKTDEGSSPGACAELMFL